MFKSAGEEKAMSGWMKRETSSGTVYEKTKSSDDGKCWNEGNSSVKQKPFCAELKSSLCELMPFTQLIRQVILHYTTLHSRLCNEKTESITHNCEYVLNFC